MRVPRWTCLMLVPLGVALLALLTSAVLDKSARDWRAAPPRDVVLVTGGAGYIGSHTVLELLKAGKDVLVVDSLVNGKRGAVDRVKALADAEVLARGDAAPLTGKLIFRVADVRDEWAITKLFFKYSISSCIHFAGLKAVGESIHTPLNYYDNNLVSTLVLLRVMAKFDVYDLIFSSSATVYGEKAQMPVSEASPTGTDIPSPYGQTKAMLEQILRDAYHAEPRWNILMLRYFNPVGAHPSGQIGEDPRGVPNNLMPFIAQVAVRRIDKLVVFGDDYDTADGTCRRDYIHIVDLAIGHVKALQKLRTSHVGCQPVNLGRGEPVSVLEMVAAFEKATGQKLPYTVGPRRNGDVPTLYANASHAKQLLSWHAARKLDDMVQDLWRWQKNNPEGYLY